MYSKVKWLMMLALFLGVGMTACKPKSSNKKKNTSAVTEKRKQACINSRGKWVNNICDCSYPLRRDPSDQYRCVDYDSNINGNNSEYYEEQRRRECRAQNRVYQRSTNRCIKSNTGGPDGNNTYRDCEAAGYYWTGDRCVTSLGRNDINQCIKTGDYDPNTRECIQINSSEKRSRCEYNTQKNNARWNDQTGRCECPNQLEFNWSALDCLPYDQGNQNYFDEQAGCQYSNGTWNNGTCMCPYQDTHWDPRSGRCVALSGYAPVCPGYYTQAGICWGMNGKQFVFNYLFGWVLQDYFINQQYGR